MRFEGLDLNLLVAFNILVEERSVSKAAERLNLSQPATSAALSRLREYFQDPILVQHGHRMYATMHAETLLPHVKALLAAARTITSLPSKFDHTTSSRTFRIGGSECLIACFVSEFVANQSKIAPSLRFELSFASHNDYEKLELGELDVLLAADNDVSANLICKPVFEDQHTLIGCAENTAFKQPFTKRKFLELDFIGIEDPGDIPNYGQGRLSAMNLTNSIKLMVPSFSVVPWLLMKTNRVSIMPKRLAEKLCQNFDLVCSEIPYEFPSFQICLNYHGARTNDAGLMWLIDSLSNSLPGQNLDLSNKMSTPAINDDQQPPC